MFRRYTAHPQPHQEPQSPPVGSDSCYGVRSLESLVWADGEKPADEREVEHERFSPTVSDPSPSPGSVQDATGSDDMGAESCASSETMTPMIDHTVLPRLQSPPLLSTTDETLPVGSRPLPPSPSATLHPLDRLAATSSSRDTKIELHRRLSLAHLPTVPSSSPSVPSTPQISDDLEGQSAPSSPASLAFSFTPSMSSVSRTSSPISGIGYRRSHRSGLGMGMDGDEDDAEGDDLVVPTLSLPSSSLHMSLRLYEGKVEDAVKIGLLGRAGHVGDVIRALHEVKGVELVDMGRGAVGVVKEQRVDAVLLTFASVEQAQRRVNDGYAAFDELLNPSLPKAKEEEVRDLARSYSHRNDWVHVVLPLEPDQVALKSLATIAPILSASTLGVPTLDLGAGDDPTTEKPSAESRAPTPSPPKLGDEPTPMPTVSRAESYFALSTAAESLSPLSLLVQALGCGPRITEASVDNFLSWRGEPENRTPLHSSFTSATSPSSSTYGSQLPMPTVARAQGGREWEAEVSRREALQRRLKHRRRPTARDEYHLDRRRRRSCGPSLFPKNGKAHSRMISSVGLGDAVLGIWGAIKGVRSWKWGLAAAAVIFVGIGWDYLARSV